MVAGVGCAFTRIGGRADEWRFPIQLPDWLARLDRAAGLRHDELTARSIYVGSTTHERASGYR